MRRSAKSVTLLAADWDRATKTVTNVLQIRFNPPFSKHPQIWSSNSFYSWETLTESGSNLLDFHPF